MGTSNGDTATVTFEVNTPTLTTRAVGDGNTAKKLYVGVYENQNGELKGPLDVSLIDGNEPVTFTDRVARVNLALAKNKEYSVIFWAETENNKDAMFDIDWDSRQLTLKSSLKANQESYDAFWAQKDVKISNNIEEKVELKRPFAQLNIGTSDSDKDLAAAAGIVVDRTEVKTKVFTTFNLQNGTAADEAEVTYKMEAIADIEGESFPTATTEQSYLYLSLNYLLMNTDKSIVDVTFSYMDEEDDNAYELKFNSVPVQRNYRTNIYGTLLTNSANYTVEILPGFDGEYNEESVVVNNAEAFVDAIEEALTNDEAANVIVLGGDINLNDLFGSSNAPATRAANSDPSWSIKYGKELTIDLNGKKLSATSAQTGKNYVMFDVRGTLTVKNGTIEYKHEGENMGWNASTNIFHVEGGVLNLDGVTAKNLGGSDMGFVAHLNNWSDYDLTLNVENSTLESNYVPVRVFNSGPRMNNVTIKNSTLKGGNYAFWVHNYTVADFGTEAKAEAQKALLNLNIYNQGNKFTPDVNGIRYGFTNSVKTDAYGITKVVSEDGTEVTLGSLVENGLVRRGVAGTEENTTIKKVVVEEGVATLYDRTFRRFYALETVELPSSLTTIGAEGTGVFQSCSNLKNIVLPENLTILGKGSFQECTSLESINIPAGVTRIESDALRNTGLKEVEFHAGVTYFGAQAFRDCKQLTKVVINAPEFTMEGNTFGIMAAPYTPMTIEVANAEMKAYVESKLTAHTKTYITVVAPDFVDNTAALQAALKEGKFVALANDLTIVPEEALTAPYGNKMALSQNGGVFNGNGKNISYTGNGDNYVVMTNGGTIKNLDIDRGFRGIVLMYPNQDVYVDNVNIGVDDEVCYTINTAEGDGTHDLYVSNSTLNGWCSIGTAVKSVNFTKCTFGQGTYYTNVYGRLVKPYVDAVFEGCDFCDMCYIDLSAFVGQKVTLKNCTVNGVKLTAQNWTSLVAPEDTCGEGQISIELKDGSYMTAENVADYVVFE